MILSTYTFKGDSGSLLESHRKMMEFFPPGSLDVHLAVTTDEGIVVFDACPDLPTHTAFVSSPEFLGTLERVGLPSPSIAVLGEVHFATMNQSVIG
ncbi:MAG TPA: hypothetical protein VFA83_07860 [Acidimicrobiales bacterium]|nr:hypothetical protein [Acidimicrobiales bacterium]